MNCIIFCVQATGWQLAEAIQLFYAGNETGAVASYSEFPPLVNAKTQIDDSLRYFERLRGNTM